MNYRSATGYPDYEDFPSNHAPTYNDSPLHPLLAAIGGNMEKYANAEDRARYHNHMMQRPLVDDGSNVHGAYASGGGEGAGWGGVPTGTGGTGYSGYGYQAPSGNGGGYDYHPSAPVHVPTGGSYSHHATVGSGYGVPPPPKHLPYPQPTLATKAKDKKKSSSSSSSKASTMNALTLLAFFFFVNLLQTCLKENMDAMNPTVMVMTTNVVRNRNTKLAEMNSREQSTSPASTFTSGANIVLQPEDLVSAAAVNPVAAAVPAVSSVKLQTSPYSDGGANGNAPITASVGNNFAGSASSLGSNDNYNHNNNNQGITHTDDRRPTDPQYSYGSNGALNGQHQYNNMNLNNNNHAYDDTPNAAEVPFSLTPTPSVVTANRYPRPDFHNSAHPYPNQTISTSLSSGNHHHYHQQQQRPYHPGHYEQESFEQQFPQHHSQSQHQHHQHQYDQNKFQEHQHQHNHESYAQGHFPQQQQSDQQDHHQEPPPHDHFQHHYPVQHSLQHSHFHSHQYGQHSKNHPLLQPSATHSESSHPWSYSPGFSSLNAHKRGSSYSPLSSYTWSSSSRPSHVSGNNNFEAGNDDDDSRYDDSFYTRSNRKF
ncbi:transcription factor mef2A [Rhagoletis pomonella]|uniref:transcription factor mef2A n=1 Tax=Rhagoletis pomonella TaxID=28610 RepID=UPI00177CF018|nr:transcription factor mef2A [Rhagoletis pomonella]